MRDKLDSRATGFAKRGTMCCNARKLPCCSCCLSAGIILSAMAVAAGLALILNSCNSTLWPMGCPLYTSAVGTVMNVTMDVFPSSTKLKYEVSIDWSVCTQKIGEGDSPEWMLAVAKRYPVGRQEQMWIPKPHTVLNTCFTDSDARNSDRQFELFGSGVALLAFALMILFGTVYVRWIFVENGVRC